jgi:uncharacterized protein YndB with AHSA1/START domain
MAAVSNAPKGSAPFTLVLERIFDAPRALVFKAWIDPKHLVHWLGPQGFTGAVVEMDAHQGGRYRFHMRSADGVEYWQQGVFREIQEPDRFVRTCIWADADGNPAGPETLMTVTFEEHHGKTKLTFEQVFDTAAACEAHRSGTASALDRLGEYLAMMILQ